MLNFIKIDTSRYIWLDYVRFIGIFLVVWGHMCAAGTTINIIYSFHMPLFFVISGYLFSRKKHTSFLVFVKTKARQLLIPYVVFSVIAFLFWYFLILRISTVDFGAFTAATLFWDFLSAQYIAYCLVLWFLPTLFLTECLYFIVSKWLSPLIVAIFFMALSFLYYHFVGEDLFWSADIVLVAVVFYAFGAILRQYGTKLLESASKIPISVIGFTLCAVLVVVFAGITGRLDMLSRNYGELYMFYLAGVAGSMAIFFLGIILERIFGLVKVISYLGANSLIVYGLHIQVMTLIGGTFRRLPGVENTILGQFVPSLIYAVVIMFVMIPVIYTINRYTPKLVGKF
ncbi:MAG: acyltransferase family protein [Mucinivorans sp.]